MGKLQRNPGRIQNGLLDTRTTTVIHGRSDEEDVPRSLSELVKASSWVIIKDGEVMPCFESEDEYWNVRTKRDEGLKTIRTIFRKTMSKDDFHLFSEHKHDVHSGYQAICNQFSKSTETEQANVLAKMEKLCCQNFETYVNNFKSLLQT